MQVVFKLFANLSDWLPREVDGRKRVDNNQIAVDVPEGMALSELIDRFALPRQLAHLVLVNGVFVPPGERSSHLLREGDEVAIWPPVAGG